MKVIINNIIGSNIPADAKLPVVSIKVISSGTRLFINPSFEYLFLPFEEYLRNLPLSK